MGSPQATRTSAVYPWGTITVSAVETATPGKPSNGLRGPRPWPKPVPLSGARSRRPRSCRPRSRAASQKAAPREAGVENVLKCLVVRVVDPLSSSKLAMLPLSQSCSLCESSLLSSADLERCGTSRVAMTARRRRGYDPVKSGGNGEDRGKRGFTEERVEHDPFPPPAPLAERLSWCRRPRSHPPS